MRAVPLPPPYLGQNDSVPLAALQNPYAERCSNFNLDKSFPILRNGDEVYTNDGSESILNLVTYGSGTTQKLFMVYDSGGQLNFDDITTLPATTVHTTPTGGDDEIHTLYFNNYLMFFGEFSLIPGVDEPQYYNGSAWGSLTYTWPSNFKPFGGNVYKNRAYFIKRFSSSYGYSEIDSISGDVTEVPLDSILTNKGYLYGIRSIALSEGIEQENVQAFVFDTGEVLVYAGAYPDSPTWRIIGRFVIPKPIYYNCFVDVRGDSYVITELGPISLRELFTKGEEEAIEKGIASLQINRWQQVLSVIYPPGVSTGNEYFLKGIYEQGNDRLTITFPYYVDYDGVAQPDDFFRMIYSFKSGAWFEQHGTVLENTVVTVPTYFKNKLYYGVSGFQAVMVAEEATGFTDQAASNADDVAMGFQLRTAPLATSKFGANSNVGIETIMKSDLYAQTQFSFISNLGVTQSAEQTLSDQGSGVANPMVDIGSTGSYTQINIEGETVVDKTIGLELYAFNLWAELGQEGSR